MEPGALPLLVKVPRLFTTSGVPLSVPPKLLARMLNPLLAVWSLNVAPLPIVTDILMTLVSPLAGLGGMADNEIIQKAANMVLEVAFDLDQHRPAGQ
jgi:hypothetical protein